MYYKKKVANLIFKEKDMFAAETEQFEILKQSLSGQRDTDERTYSSVAVLAERLERLRKSSSLFEDVSFSPYVEELASREMISALT